MAASFFFAFDRHDSFLDRMSDRQLTLSWKPSPPAGQHIPPTYTVEMAKLPEGGFAVINTGT